MIALLLRRKDESKATDGGEGKKNGGIIFSQEAVCGSDSGADTRDSESTLPASLADEREKGRGWKIYRDRKKTGSREKNGN